ncbi:MAG: hypothetical protein JOZ62_14800, partial [Acidobacteriaceae bacterium]|nr:hypothetical protein [Acidobacteriaceae bacterium]
MAKLYHKSTGRPAEPRDAQEMLRVIETFVRSCASPAVLEYGEHVMPLKPKEHTLELRSGRLWIDVWDETRSLSRRILTIERHATGILDCSVHRFGGVPGKLSFLDLERPQTGVATLRGSRQSFGEQFRRMLFRQFPGWEISALSSAMDLQRSFSPVFPRATLTKGNHRIAALACPSPEDEAALLTFALLWFDYVQGRGRREMSSELCLFVPEQAGCLTAHRLRWLDRAALKTHLFRFNEHGCAGQVDPDDLGNLDTRVSPHYIPVELGPEISALLSRLTAVQGIGCCPELNGSVSIRARGIEFARIEKGRVFLGIEAKREIDVARLAEVEEYAAQIVLLTRDTQGNIHNAGLGLSGASERWFEAAVRSHLTLVDASVLETPVHGQVLTFAGTDRNLVDLLAVSSSGRLVIVELKTTEDIHLPIQALDYWMRIRWHTERGELQHLFPGIALSGNVPKLLLVGPAISFHPANATVLRYFSPEIDVERVGINSGWQREFKVVLRLRGADVPQSHETSNECSGSC